jgi:microcystin-dependent protein
VNIGTSSSGGHSHTIAGWSASGGSIRRIDTAIGSTGLGPYTTSTDGAHTHSVTGNTAVNSSGVSSVDNLQPTLVLNYIIKL